ncbi:FAD-dependent oxidoreductase [Actinomadura viridis]|uniref:3-(3-hydroxy-phenyl)propionate hydroxylase n=1 Tax=Actinomadura viridis TaxID=58110 RepID=A0A931GIX4_9ACTN|nr:FAD-dependent monooxygenase [Actinomadura viridis]MBG6088715.1 3-(3-hydroxy-phenyl)propionate hydroxylase [Actinomadura viridis]
MTVPPEHLPVAVIGAGPVGLITALGLAHHGVPAVVFEEDGTLSLDTKAGTVLTRTLEVLHRYGALPGVLRASLRLEEIGDIDRATNTPARSVRTGALVDDTRFPFVVNIPQHELEPVLRAALDERCPGALRMSHRLTDFTQHDDHVELRLDTPGGPSTVRARYVLACDGGRSRVRERLGIAVSGTTLDERYMLVDLKVDLDVANPRDYPYLAYFGDPEEWMILVRQPHCWRFLYPLPPGRPEPTRQELAGKARRFIGDVSGLEVIGTNVYTVHQRVADRWRAGRVFLMGDAAHLITPMWALGLNTGVLDASNLPWRLAWVMRGWAGEDLLDGYEREQTPVAVRGSGQMAEAARAYMARRTGGVTAMGEGDWGNAFTRGLLGVRLDVDGTGDWSMVKSGSAPAAVRAGDRVPDLPLFGHDGQVFLHDLAADGFVALYFTDTRRGPRVSGPDSPALRRFAVSRWDAPHDSGLRRRALFDPGGRVERRFGVPPDTVVLVRPDAHVAAIAPFDPRSGRDIAAELYARAVGRPVPAEPEQPEREEAHGRG